MSDLQDLFHQHDKVARWEAERENASARLELAKIHERLASVKSQHQPIADITSMSMSPRDMILHAAHFVVYGKFPPTPPL